MRRMQRAGLAAATVAVSAPRWSAPDRRRPGREPGKAPFTFAVIGDIPYGDAQIARFPKVVDQINDDPAVEFVDHLGDIKSGSSVCSDDYITMIRGQFDRFQDPLVYTPGTTSGPTATARTTAATSRTSGSPSSGRPSSRSPGKTLGQQSVGVQSQVDRGFPEQVRYSRAGVAFGVPHIVGSNNGLAPWTGLTEPTAQQVDGGRCAHRGDDRPRSMRPSTTPLRPVTRPSCC